MSRWQCESISISVLTPRRRRNAGRCPAAPAAQCRPAAACARSASCAASGGHAELVQQPRHAARHERLQHGRDRPQHVDQHAQHGRHPRRVGLAQRPGRLVIDIGVGGADHLPDLLQRLAQRHAVHQRPQHAPAAPRAASSSAASSVGRRGRARGSTPPSCARSATACAAPDCRDRWPARCSAAGSAPRR